jgi:hypothetical protein
MGTTVKCPYCDWRGFRFYFPHHYEESHPSMVYVDAIRVDEKVLDSRPRMPAVR